MTPSAIAALRLSAQLLDTAAPLSPPALVGYFGAMQAQDYAMSKWGVGIRTGIQETKIEEAIRKGEIIRTHILRPTWHLVAAPDLRWMMDLTAPPIKKVILKACEKYNISAPSLKRYLTSFEKALAGNKHLTRAELMAGINLKGTPANDIRPTLICMHAELHGVLCSGEMSGKQITYALMDERVPQAPSLPREEALVRLAQQYFISRGPATVHDFSWWSGLNMKDCRQAVAAIKSSLGSVTVEEKTYWYNKKLKEKPSLHRIHFIPAFDEFLISYTDRKASLALKHQPDTFTTNGILYPVILEDGMVMGTWKRTLKKDSVIIDTKYFRKPDKASIRLHLEAAGRVGTFLGVKTILH
jgi:hypothetical protein